MKNIILIIREKDYQFDDINQLKNFLLPGYEKLSSNDITKKLYEMIFGYSVLNDLKIYDTNKGVFGDNYEIENRKIDLQNAIVINNIDTFILSLCMHNAIVLLEEKQARYYTKSEIFQGDEQNYMIVNAFSKELLKKMVGEK